VEFHPDGDLRFPFNNHEFFIECKRPQGEDQINSRVKHAAKQLEESYAAAGCPSKARGFVALSLTKLVNRHGGPVHLRSANELQDFLDALSLEIITTHGRLWQRSLDSRTMGALLDLSGLFIGTTDASLSLGGYITMNDRERLTSSDNALLERFAEVMTKGIQGSA